ncbi:MAG: hypothetical protein L0191_00890, partial [Acidobacteria bacterium]|nr:hypothetical protein [Acidobacteriota bacterium]
YPGGVRGLIVNGGIGMYDSRYRLIVAVHHMKPGTEVTLEPLLGTDTLKEAAGRAFYGGGYRYAGTVILDGEECCPDRALEIAWARTQNLDDDVWREGQRSTVPGDLFAVGHSLYVCAPMGFCPITHTHEPKVLEVAHEDQHVVLITLDNGETRELSRSDLVSVKAEDLVGRTERAACHMGPELARSRSGRVLA